MGLQVIFMYTLILLTFSNDVLTFQIYLSETFKNNLIKNKAEESVYQIWRFIKKLELPRVCGIAEGETHGMTDQYREPRNRPTRIAQLLYDKGAKSIQVHSLVNKWCWRNQASIGKYYYYEWIRSNLNLSLTSYTKINLKQTMDLNEKYKTIKYLGGKTRRKSLQLG